MKRTHFTETPFLLITGTKLWASFLVPIPSAQKLYQKTLWLQRNIESFRLRLSSDRCVGLVTLMKIFDIHWSYPKVEQGVFCHFHFPSPRFSASFSMPSQRMLWTFDCNPSSSKARKRFYDALDRRLNFFSFRSSLLQYFSHLIRYLLHVFIIFRQASHIFVKLCPSIYGLLVHLHIEYSLVYPRAFPTTDRRYTYSAHWIAGNNSFEKMKKFQSGIDFVL